MINSCPRCPSLKIWSPNDGRFRCAHCRNTFTDPRRLGKLSKNKRPLHN